MESCVPPPCMVMSLLLLSNTEILRDIHRRLTLPQFLSCLLLPSLLSCLLLYYFCTSSLLILLSYFPPHLFGFLSPLNLFIPHIQTSPSFSSFFTRSVVFFFFPLLIFFAHLNFSPVFSPHAFISICRPPPSSFLLPHLYSCPSLLLAHISYSLSSSPSFSSCTLILFPSFFTLSPFSGLFSPFLSTYFSFCPCCLFALFVAFSFLLLSLCFNLSNFFSVSPLLSPLFTSILLLRLIFPSIPCFPSPFFPPLLLSCHG